MRLPRIALGKKFANAKRAFHLTVSGVVIVIALFFTVHFARQSTF
jgi:hypothetical protein